MATFSDNFNRANGSPGANWIAVNSGTWEIFNNELRQVSVGSVYRLLRWNGGAFDSANLYARVIGRSLGIADGIGVVVRCPTSGTGATSVDGYALTGWPNDQWYFIVLTDAGETEVIPLGGTIVANTNYTIEIRVSGNTITGFVNNTQIGQITRTTYTAGGVAILSYGRNLYYDNFEAGDLVTGRTGSVNVTQDEQIAATTSRVYVVGSSLLPETNFVAAVNGLVTCRGVLEREQTPDIFVSNVNIPVYAVVYADTQQNLSSGGVVFVNGGTSATTDENIGAGQGVVGLTSAVVLSQAEQFSDSSAMVVITGNFIQLQTQNITIVGNVSIVGQSALNEDSHLLQASGVVGFSVVSGQCNVTQEDQFVVGNTNISVSAQTILSSANDALTASTVVSITGILVGESADSCLSNGQIGNYAQAIYVQNDQVLQLYGVAIVAGTGLSVQESDNLNSLCQIVVVGDSSVTQIHAVSSNVQIVAQGISVVAQQGNTLSAIGGVGSIPIVGSAELLQVDNAIVTQVVLTVSGQLISQAQDTDIISNATLPIASNLSTVQQNHVLFSTGNATHVSITGSANLLQIDDAIIVQGTLTVWGQLVAQAQDESVVSETALLVVGNIETVNVSNVVKSFGVLDLIYAVVYGIITGPKGKGNVKGISATGQVRGINTNGSI